MMQKSRTIGASVHVTGSLIPPRDQVIFVVKSAGGCFISDL